MSDTNEPTAIQTRMQQMGASALDAAQEARTKKRGEQFVGLVEKLLDLVERIAETRAVLDLQESYATRRIAAIRAGEFSAVAGVLRYNEDDLNQKQLLRGQTVIGLE